jgi:hypothetical protein
MLGWWCVHPSWGGGDRVTMKEAFELKLNPQKPCFL